jgi:polyhydroxyalkanoate synthase
VKDLRFVLSSSGHIAALVNPPGNRKATYRIGGIDEPDPTAWVKSAESNPDSWWPDFAARLDERSGKKKAAPDFLGGATIVPIEPAPGSYVLEH